LLNLDTTGHPLPVVVNVLAGAEAMVVGRLLVRKQSSAPQPLPRVRFTAEEVSAYKPNPAHFLLFQSTFGASADVWIHVAQSYFHDIKPTSELGITRVWVNRQGEKDDPSIADALVKNLTELPEAVRRLAELLPRPSP